MTRTVDTLLRAAQSTAQALWRWYGTAVRIIVTLVLMALVVSRVSLPTLHEEVCHIRLLPLGAAVVLTYLAWIINTCKWQRLLASAGSALGIWELLHLNLVAIFYGLALPGQITGEVLKAVRLGRRMGSPAVAYSSVWLDRLTGVVGLTAIGGAGIVLAPLPQSDTAMNVTLLGGFIAVLAISLCLLVLPLLAAPRRALARGEHRSGPVVGAIRWVFSLFAAAQFRLPVSELAGASAVAIAFQLGGVASVWVVALAFDVEVPFLALAWISSAVALLQLLPISVAGMGIRESSYIALLSLYAVPGDKALAVSLTTFVLLVLLGATGAILELIDTSLAKMRTGSSAAAN